MCILLLEHISIFYFFNLTFIPETITTLLFGYTLIQNVFGVKQKSCNVLFSYLVKELGTT